MTTLIAVDGDYLNRALHSKARLLNKKGEDLPKNMGKPRLRIDFESLASLLAKPLGVDSSDLLLNYYADALIPGEAGRKVGRINKYWHDRGWGFIAAPPQPDSGLDAESYFFHHQDIANKSSLRNSDEKKYPQPSTPEFTSRIRGKIVSYKVIYNDGREKASDVRLEQGAAVERYYQLRKESFLRMLEESGYELVRCSVPDGHTQGKSKTIDCMIYYDALRELQDEQDRFVLVSDDPVFGTLLRGLDEDGVLTTVAGFKSSKLANLAEHAAHALVLDSHLKQLQLDYEDEVAEKKATSLV